MSPKGSPVYVIAEACAARGRPDSSGRRARRLDLSGRRRAATDLADPHLRKRFVSGHRRKRLVSRRGQKDHIVRCRLCCAGSDWRKGNAGGCRRVPALDAPCAQRPRFPPRFPAFWRSAASFPASFSRLLVAPCFVFGNEALFWKRGAQRPRFPPWSRLVFASASSRSASRCSASSIPISARPIAESRRLCSPAGFDSPRLRVCVCGRVCVGGVVVGVSIATRTTAGTTLGSSATPR